MAFILEIKQSKYKHFISWMHSECQFGSGILLVFLINITAPASVEKEIIFNLSKQSFVKELSHFYDIFRFCTIWELKLNSLERKNVASVSRI